MSKAKDNQLDSRFINDDVILKNVIFKRRKVKGQYKAILEDENKREIWIQACKNGVMATSRDEFARVALA